MSLEDINVISDSPKTSVLFLVFMGLLTAPKCCPHGHPWVVGGDGNFVCHHRPAPADPGHRGGRGRRKTCGRPEQCGAHKSWRNFCLLAQLVPHSVSAVNLVRLMVYVALKRRVDDAVLSTGLERHCIGAAYHVFRLFIMRFQACTQERICDGTRRLAGAIDETYLIVRPATFS